MTMPLRVLIVEDSRADTLLVLEVLRDGDFNISYLCVVEDFLGILSAKEKI